MNIAANHHLENKVIVITGAGGILCAFLAKQLAHTKANIALLDLNFEAADKVAQEINQTGGNAKAYKTNVLELENIQEVRDQIATDFGTCDILINGAGGNNPKATTDNEFHRFNLSETTKTFLNWTKQGLNLSLISITWEHYYPPKFLQKICLVKKAQTLLIFPV
ncbi:oxidoreductase [Rodentibacter pneumotropicus]|uniref:Oxidoreductase n=1 Tax=Rodentibacter pneumotropicus TaxID=758 RepID=A0A3S4U1X7_9PAST|nr:oxidoreductase [Rodentibacter pneumotropicus]